MNSIQAGFSAKLAKAVRRLKSKLKPDRRGYDGYYPTWEAAEAKCAGSDPKIMIERVLSARLKVMQGNAVYERDSIVFNEIQYSWPLAATLLWVAAKNGGKLHVLDFGGSLGSSYFQNALFLSHLTDLSWSVVEQASFVAAGKQHVQTDRLKFYESIDEALHAVSPNLILISGSAQYIKNIGGLLAKVNSVTAPVLLIDRTPVSNGSEDLICVQQVSADIYDAKHPIWVLSKEKLCAQLYNWQLVTSFPSIDGPVKLGSGKKFEFTGLLFERKP